jgi:hypothetical protein
MIIHEDKFDKFRESCPLLLVTEDSDLLCKANQDEEEYEYCEFETCPMVFWINVITE